MLTTNFSGDGVYYGAGGILGQAVKRWKAGGIKGAMKESASIGKKAATAVATGGASLIPEAASWLKKAPGGAPAPAPGFKLDFKNPLVLGGLGVGAILLLMMLKK
jgi:hypothetical protein